MHDSCMHDSSTVMGDIESTYLIHSNKKLKLQQRQTNWMGVCPTFYDTDWMPGEAHTDNDTVPQPHYLELSMATDRMIRTLATFTGYRTSARNNQIKLKRQPVALGCTYIFTNQPNKEWKVNKRFLVSRLVDQLLNVGVHRLGRLENMHGVSEMKGISDGYISFLNSKVAVIYFPSPLLRSGQQLQQSISYIPHSS